MRFPHIFYFLYSKQHFSRLKNGDRCHGSSWYLLKLMFSSRETTVVSDPEVAGDGTPTQGDRDLSEPWNLNPIEHLWDQLTVPSYSNRTLPKTSRSWELSLKNNNGFRFIKIEWLIIFGVCLWAYRLLFK